MSIGQKPVNYCIEIDTLLGVVVTAVADVKAGKKPAQVIGDIVPLLISALTGVGELAAEIKDRPDLEKTVALKVCELVDTIVG